MDITVIGAGGSVGRQVAQLIVAEGLLQCEQRLTLVGNQDGGSAKSVFGFAVDLMDAHAEVSPQIDVILGPEGLKGDLIVVAAGATVPLNTDVSQISRDSLAQQNLPVFESYGSALAKQGHGGEIVICISNPNELAVAVFAKHLGRRRVIGMGAFLDSLRFRKEIALDLGIRRQRIHGFMVGEHGFNMVPLWSTVHIYGFEGEKLRQALEEMRRGHQTAGFPEDVDQARNEIGTLITEGRVRKAYALIDQYPPDIRVALKPFVTHFSGSKTVVGTAKAAVELLRTITQGNDALISGQACLEGEFHGIHGTIGVPLVIGNQGVDRVIEMPLAKEEKDLLVRSARNVQQRIDELL